MVGGGAEPRRGKPAAIGVPRAAPGGAVPSGRRRRHVTRGRGASHPRRRARTLGLRCPLAAGLRRARGRPGGGTGVRAVPPGGWRFAIMQDEKCAAARRVLVRTTTTARRRADTPPAASVAANAIAVLDLLLVVVRGAAVAGALAAAAAAVSTLVSADPRHASAARPSATPAPVSASASPSAPPSASPSASAPPRPPRPPRALPPPPPPPRPLHPAHTPPPQVLHALVSVLSLAFGLVASLYVLARAAPADDVGPGAAAAAGWAPRPINWTATLPFRPLLGGLARLLHLSQAQAQAQAHTPSALPARPFLSAATDDASTLLPSPAPALLPAAPPGAASAPTLKLLYSLPTTTALACIAAIALLVLIAFLSNPGDVSFQSFVTDLTFREHLRAAQHNLRALTLDSPEDTLDAANLPRPPPHMLSFANHLAISVKTPAYTRYDYRLFSVVIVARRSVASASSQREALKSRAPSPPPPPVSGLLSAIEDRSYWFFGFFGSWYIGTHSWARTFLHDVKRAAAFGQAWHQPLQAPEDPWGVIAMENDALGQGV